MMNKRIILHAKILVAMSVFVLLCNEIIYPELIQKHSKKSATLSLTKNVECHSLALEDIKSTSYKYQVDHLFMKALKDDKSFIIPQNIKPFFFSFSDLGRNVCADINLSDITDTIEKNQYNFFFANDFKAKMPKINHKHVRFVFDHVKKQNENEIQIITGYSTPFDIKRSFGIDMTSNLKNYHDHDEKHDLFLFFQTDNDAVYSNRLKVACELQSMNNQDGIVAFISKSYRSKKAKERLMCPDGSEMISDNRLNLNDTLEQLRKSKCFWCPRGDVPTSDRIHLAFELLSIPLVLESEYDELMQSLPSRHVIPWNNIIVKVPNVSENVSASLIKTCNDISKSKEKYVHRMIKENKHHILWGLENSDSHRILMQKAIKEFTQASTI